MKKLLFYLFLVVITDPYRDIDYDKINVYEVNYCEGYGCPSEEEKETIRDNDFYTPLYPSFYSKDFNLDLERDWD